MVPFDSSCSTASRRWTQACASMLVHTSQFTDMHFKLAERIDALLDEFRSVAPATLMDQLREVWEDEVDRVPPEAVGLPATASPS